MSDFTDVRNFHVKFQLPVDGDEFPRKAMSPEIFSFRHKFLFEEGKEYDEAYRHNDLVKAVDSLIDLVYVTYGAALFMHAGPNCLDEVAWPTFSSASTAAFRMGMVERENQKRPPHLIKQSLHTVMSWRMTHCMDQFKRAHFESLDHDPASWAMPMMLTSLWELSFAAYLTGHLMDLTPDVWQECWNHVHTKNMLKIRADATGSNSKRSSPWDVIKPEGWTPPDPLIRQTLIDAGALQ